MPEIFDSPEHHLNLDNSKKIKGLYAITDGTASDSNKLYQAVEAALDGGCRILQYRNKSASSALQLEQAIKLRDICNHYQCLFLINDNVDLCQQSNAQGVHLGQSDGSVGDARQRLGSKAVIGVTCHNSLQLAERAWKQGADYIAFGRLFDSVSKPEAPGCSLDVISEAKKRFPLPVVGIGGITPNNARFVLDHGADAIAVIYALFAQGQYSADEIRHNAQQFSKCF